jgi:hypothetical protein
MDAYYYYYYPFEVVAPKQAFKLKKGKLSFHTEEGQFLP